MIPTGVLLVNLGTPESPTKLAVKKYLTEFLLDPRVIDIPWLKRQLLVRGAIIPSRLNQSLQSYRAIWTQDGSPLLVHSQKAAALLQKRLGNDFSVRLAMRYQTPSIAEGVDHLLQLNIKQLIVLPLFPQYASATTGSVFEKIANTLSSYTRIPKISFVDHFYDHPSFIHAFKSVSTPFSPEDYDHVLFSFHGLPERQLRKGGNKDFCTKANCCEKQCPQNQHCYAAQCYQTAYRIAERCGISNYSVCFQSRLGKEPWIQPFTSDTLVAQAKKGAKKVLVFCPAFVADCLETIYEISVEYQELFKHAGGERLDLVPSLNSHPAWIEALERIVQEQVI